MECAVRPPRLMRLALDVLLFFFFKDAAQEKPDTRRKLKKVMGLGWGGVWVGRLCCLPKVDGTAAVNPLTDAALLTCLLSCVCCGGVSVSGCGSGRWSRWPRFWGCVRLVCRCLVCLKHAVQDMRKHKKGKKVMGSGGGRAGEGEAVLFEQFAGEAPTEEPSKVLLTGLCVCVCVRACVRACVRVCVFVCASVGGSWCCLSAVAGEAPVMDAPAAAAMLACLHLPVSFWCLAVSKANAKLDDQRAMVRGAGGGVLAGRVAVSVWQLSKLSVPRPWSLAFVTFPLVCRLLLFFVFLIVRKR